MDRAFLKDTVPELLLELTDAMSPAWGEMRPQQMLEHLLWALEMSTGTVEVEGPSAPFDPDRLRAFLGSDAPTPRGYMNPLLVEGLPPVRFPDLHDARLAVESELRRFLSAEHEVAAQHVHPIFGPLSWADWHRAHAKHFRHHLTQYGLGPEK